MESKKNIVNSNLNKTKYSIVHIAAHMGGGAGKAIAGLVCNLNIPNLEHSIILLENPKEERYIQICHEAGIPITVFGDSNTNMITETLNQADVVIINWWNHPAIPFFMSSILADIHSRWIFWFHINGCSYPYIPFSLIEDADGILFSTNYSFENPLWNQTEKKTVQEKAELVLGMGEFIPERIIPKEDYSSEEIKIGYVGTVSYSKMHCKYLDYIERIYEEIPNVRFIFVGECDDSIEKVIQQRNLQNIIECVGKVEDVYSFYRDMDILLYLLNADNYGTTENVLLEAMAVGLPIIVYDNPVERNIIEDKVCGYVAHNEDEIIQIIKKLSTDYMLREYIGKCARNTVLGKYNLHENVERYVKSIMAVLEKDAKLFPFQRAIGTSPFEWFLNFSGKEKNSFVHLAEGIDTFEKSELIIRELPQIYVGRNKSSIFHFQKYYTDDERLNRICQKVKLYFQKGN